MKNRDILIHRAPDHMVDSVTLAVRKWLANRQPELNFACVRITEGAHSAVGIVWYHLKLVENDEIDNFNLADTNIETGVFFAQAGIPTQSKRWLSEGLNLRQNGPCRFKSIVNKWAKDQLGSADILIEV